MFFAQLRNELWKLFGKKRTYIGFGVFIVAQATMLLALSHSRNWHHNMERVLNGNGYFPIDFISALTATIPMLMPQLILLMPLFATLVGGDLVAKESEDGTLRMILCRPISRTRLLLVKWIAGMIFAIVLVVALGGIALGFARILFPWKGMFVFIPGQTFAVLPADVGLIRYIGSHVFFAINACVMVSLSFMFSCFNMKPAAATILALAFLIVSFVMELIPFFEDYNDWLVTHHFRAWLLIFQTPIPWAQIAQSQVILLALAITTFVIGCVAFQLRDIKS